MIPLIIQDQFYTIQNRQRSPIPQTSNWSGIFFDVSYSKPALGWFLFFVTSYTLTYVLGSSLIWKFKILNIEYLLLFLQAGTVEENKTKIENSTRPNR